MDVFDLLAKLTLDTSEYEGGLNNARDSAEKGGSKIGAALGTAGKVASAAIAAASTAVVGFGAASVSAGADFDKSMSQVAATMGYTVDDLNDSTSEASQNFNKLRDFAQEMGSTTAFSATQAADALNYMALAGYDTETSIQMLPSVLDLAASGSMDLARASDMVTDTQSALGLSLEETSTLVDQMAKTASKSNTSVEQLGDAMLTIGATARNVAGGTTELSTVLGVLADNGIKGAEGGTHLRNMILSLQTPTDDGVAAMEQLGLSVYDADGNMRSLIDIIADLQNGLGDMDQAARDAVLNDLFNKTDLASVNALLGTRSERFDELTAAIQDADGAAKAMAETQLDNLAGDVTLFKSALEGAQIAISDGLTPSLRNFVQFGTEGISRLTEAFKEDGLDGAMNALSDIIDQGIEMIFSALPTIMNAGLKLLEALASGIINNLPKLMDAAFEIMMTLADDLIDSLPQLIPAIVQIIITIVEKLTEPNTLTRLVQASLQIMLALAKGLINAIPQLIQSVPTIISNLVQSLISMSPQIVSAGIQLIGMLATGLINGIGSVISAAIDIGNQIFGVFSDLISSAWHWGVDLIGNFISGIVAKAGELWETVKGIAGGVKNFLGFSEPKEGPLSDFHTYAPDMMELFAKGIRDNEGMLKDTVASAFDFGNMTVKSSSNTSASGGGFEWDGLPIVVQCVLDGRIIAENTTKWQRRMVRATG